ncbi:MAG: dihydrolipoamide acetyltransferase family protein [Balneolaceae bacterium]|nr:dihydrolipoamide acetyltransferase family protein [Balneolaceae bacterium]
MAIKVEMPKLSDTMEEGVLAKWNIKEGDTVSAGDIIADVETDKATMEMEVFDSGTVLKLLVDEGDTIPLGGLVAVIGEPGEDISGLVSGGASAGASGATGAESGGESSASEAVSETANEGEAPDSAREAANEAATPDPASESFDPIFGGLGSGTTESSDAQSTTASASSVNGRVKASPLAKKVAAEKGVDLQSLQGSGPNGRVVIADVEKALAGGTTSPAAPAAQASTVSAPTSAPEPAPSPQPAAPVARPSSGSEKVKVSQMRKVIARRLSESKFTNPHFYVSVDVDMANVVAARGQLNQVSPVKISFNDIILKASALSLKKHPWVNGSWNETEMTIHHDVHIAFAVAVDEGLLTPVITHTDQKSLMEISAESKELAGLARDKKLQPQQMEGSTFTISNLGMFGIDEFTAIINPPNAAILAVGGIRDEAVVKDGAIVPGKRLKLTLSSDHRIVDGAKAAEYLNELKHMLENPLAMML